MIRSKKLRLTESPFEFLFIWEKRFEGLRLIDIINTESYDVVSKIGG